MFRRFSQHLGRIARIVTTLVALGGVTAEAVEVAEVLDSGYRVTRWTAENGLPQNQVRALVQTRDGYLWLGTLNGLTRFDGNRFKTFDHSNTPEMTHDSINSLAEDAEDGSLWIGTGEGLLHYQDHQFKRVVSTNTIPGVVGFITPAPGGGVWFSPARGSIGRVKADQLTEFTFSAAAPGQEVQQICGLNQELPLVLVHRDIYQLDWNARTLQPFLSPLSAAHAPCYSIFVDADGSLWLSSDTEIWHRGGTNWLRVANMPPPTHPAPVTLYRSRDRQLWVGRWAGSFTSVFSVADGKLKGLAPFKDLAGLDVVAFIEDNEGNVWVGTTSGLLRFTPKQLGVFSVLNGMRNDDIRTVLAGRDDTIWLGTSAGISYVRHAKVGDLPLPSKTWSGTTPGMTALMEDDLGRLWLSPESGRLVVTGAAADLEHVSLTDFNALGGVQFAYRDSRSRTWIATRRGVLCDDHGRTNTFTKAEGLSCEDVRVVHEDFRGDIWFGTYGGGLNRWREGKIASFPTHRGEYNNRTWWIHEDQKGVFWVATQEGLNRFQPPVIGDAAPSPKAAGLQQVFTFTTQHGLYENVVNNIQEDDLGYLWLSGLRGIYRVSRQELNEVAAAKRTQVRCLPLGESDGMLSSECNGGENQPAGCKDPYERIWFPTTKGVVVIDPKQINHAETPPSVVIEELKSNHEVLFGDVVSSQETMATESPQRTAIVADGLRVRPGGGRVLEIQYTANTFGQPERVHFRYQLEGYETDWHRDDANRRVAFYTNLKPNRYIFHVVACNARGFWNERGAQISFVIAPRFYQTPLFYGLTAGALLLAAGTWHYSRVQRINRLRSLEQQHALDQERARIARDIHDDLGSRFLQISVLGELTSRKLEANSEAAQQLDHLRGTANEAFQALDEIVWAANPRKDSVEGLVSYLREYLPQVLSPSGITCRLEFPQPIPSDRLGAGVRHQIFLVVKEGLQNVLKHARARAVTLSLKLNETGVDLSLRDDGVGFDPGRTSGNGNGLMNMRERIAQLHGQLVVDSAPGRGTEIRLQVPAGTGVS